METVRPGVLRCGEVIGCRHVAHDEPGKVHEREEGADEAHGKNDDEFQRGKGPGTPESSESDVDPQAEEHEGNHQRHGHVAEDHLVDVDDVEPVDGPGVDRYDEDQTDEDASEGHAIRAIEVFDLWLVQGHELGESPMYDQEFPCGDVCCSKL